MDKERERLRKKIFHKPKDTPQESSQEVGNSNAINPEINPALLKMFPPERIKRLMEKEARRYKAALEKKWDRWLKAVNK